MADDSDVVYMWSFGIGSNMNVDIVENKMKIKVIDHACAVLAGCCRSNLYIEIMYGTCTVLRHFIAAAQAHRGS